ncbi:MAG: hypothetical protein V9G14_14515 [Cypionkella sp.]
MITAMAHMPAQSMVNCAVKSRRPTGRVLELVERVSWLASANSFHEVRKAKTPAAAMPDLASGKLDLPEGLPAGAAVDLRGLGQ